MKRKRFNHKELAEWMCEYAKEMIEEKDTSNGYEGDITLASTDLNDLRRETKDLANYLSKERTELLYH